MPRADALEDAVRDPPTYAAIMSPQPAPPPSTIGHDSPLASQAQPQPLQAQPQPEPSMAGGQFGTAETVRVRDFADNVSTYSHCDSVLPAYAPPSLRDRYKSEAEYIAGLRAWAKGKRYVDQDERSFAYFGGKSIRDYENQQGLDLSRFKKSPTAAKPVEQDKLPAKVKQQTRRSIGGWLRRKDSGGTIEVPTAE